MCAHLAFHSPPRFGIVWPVTAQEAGELLERFRAGRVSAEEVLHAFQAAPVADLGFAQIDLHRSLRKNFPEVVYGEGKTPRQVAAIAERIGRSEKRFLVTRITPEHARAVRRKIKAGKFHEAARCITLDKAPLPER